MANGCCASPHGLYSVRAVANAQIKATRSARHKCGGRLGQIFFPDNCNRRTTQSIASRSFRTFWIPASAEMTKEYWICPVGHETGLPRHIQHAPGRPAGLCYRNDSGILCGY
jgi:hypothetical protein